VCGESLVRPVLSKWRALDNHFNFIITVLLTEAYFLLARGVALDFLVCKIRMYSKNCGNYGNYYIFKNSDAILGFISTKLKVVKCHQIENLDSHLNFKKYLAFFGAMFWLLLFSLGPLYFFKCFKSSPYF
jgi:hypothetical protein